MAESDYSGSAWRAYWPQFPTEDGRIKLLGFTGGRIRSGDRIVNWANRWRGQGLTTARWTAPELPPIRRVASLLKLGLA